MKNWTNQDIIDYYDSHMDCTIDTLVKLTGYDKSVIKAILLNE